jgi:HAE1 family hydrophobic/amphiphilic exporter-1
MAKFFINRPIVAIVIAIIMTIVGGLTFTALPVAQFPNIVPPEIQVKASYTGADAVTVEQSVATPIEQQMSGVDHMNYLSSVNANNGAMTLTVNFDGKTDPNTAQILAQMRQSQAASQLPAEVNAAGVTVQKSTSSPLILFALYSPKGTYDNVFLANYAYINLNDQFTRVPGIASVRSACAAFVNRHYAVDIQTSSSLSLSSPTTSSSQQQLPSSRFLMQPQLLCWNQRCCSEFC